MDAVPVPEFLNNLFVFRDSWKFDLMVFSRRVDKISYAKPYFLLLLACLKVLRYNSRG
ncbi:MAG: hypothetical protein M1431_01985 [Candidatus Thermoplasmatota archaeon]|nr:hypothetical protein [Candidatus Thermoplasmatota archaeon]